VSGHAHVRGAMGSAGEHTTGCGALIRRARPVACCALLLAVGALSAGCNKPLFPENSTRTQFETYDRLRQQSAQLEEEDEFGQKRPALRARLTPPN